MIATAVVAVLIGLCMAPEIAAIGLMFFHVIAIGCAIIATISGRGWIRPFAIIVGLYLIGLAFALTTMHLNGPEEFAIIELINMAIATVTGMSGAVFHSYLLRRNGMVPVPNLPFVRKWLINESPVDVQD